MSNDVGISEEIVQLIDLFLAHKKEYVQGFLKKNGFKFSRTKEDLRERLLNLCRKCEITMNKFYNN